MFKELGQKYEDGNFLFSIDKLRNKFKICVSECKKITLTARTLTGIKGVQDEKQLGAQFNQLSLLVQERDSCNPDMAAKCSLSLQLSDGELVKRASNNRTINCWQGNYHVCSISSIFSLKACSFLGNWFTLPLPCCC